MSTAILLLAHGTPESPGQVPEYMRFITGGRQLPEAVIEEVQHRYSLIGRSPLTDITRSQAEKLRAALNMPVYFGMRNWHPFIKDVVAKMLSDGVTRAVTLCMAPQNSRTSVGLYHKSLMEAAEGKLEIDFIESWHDEPQLARAFAVKLAQAYVATIADNTKPAILFTAHSVPSKTIQPESSAQSGDPYSVQCKHTAENVVRELFELMPSLKGTEWSFAFQSQGMSGGTWIGPTVEDTLTALSELGHKSVVIQPIGFVCDHVEVLYDIDIAFRKFAADKGMKLARTESLNDSPEFIAALADIARRRLLPS